MKIINAEILIEYLNDYALSEMPLYPEDNPEIYETIKNCIKIVKQQPQIKLKARNEDGKIKIKVVRTK